MKHAGIRRQIFTIIVVLYPLLDIFVSPVPKVDLGTFCLLLFFPFFAIDMRLSVRNMTSKLILYYALYVTLSFPITFLTLNLEVQMQIIGLFRLLKLIFVLVLVFGFIGADLFDYKLGLRILKITTFIATAVILFQFIYYQIFNEVLIFIPLNLVKETGYGLIDYNYVASKFFRPTSIFLEPAHYVQYVIVCLILILLENPRNKYRLSFAVFISIGIIISTSGQGLLFLALVWSLWIIIRLKANKYRTAIGLLRIIPIFGIVILVILLISQLGIVESSMNRVIASTGGLGDASVARLNTYKEYMNLPSINKIFGTGYGILRSTGYFNSFAYTLYCNGLIGGLIVLWIFLQELIFSRGVSRYITLVYFLLIFGSFTFTASGITFFFMLITFSKKSSMIPG